MCHLLNFKKKKRLMITHVTNKIIVNLKSRKGNNLFKPLIKENLKYIKFNQFFNYYIHNKNEIKESQYES